MNHVATSAGHRSVRASFNLALVAASAGVMLAAGASWAHGQAQTRYRFEDTFGNTVYATQLSVLDTALIGSGASAAAGTLTGFFSDAGFGTASLGDFNNLQVTFSADRSRLTALFEPGMSFADTGSPNAVYISFSAFDYNRASVPLGIDEYIEGSWVRALPGATGVGTDFGRLIVGQSRVQQVRVTNSGSAYSLLSGSFGSSASPFSASSTGFVNVEQGAQAASNVTFTPASVGVFNGSIGITSNGGNTSASVTGRGISLRVLDNGTANFGNMLVNAAGSTTVTLGDTVTGDPLNYTRPTLAGTGATSGGVSIGSGAPLLYDSLVESTTRTVTALFNTPGFKSGFVPLTVTPEGNVGTETYTQGVNYTATVYSLGVPTAPAGPFATGQNIVYSEASGLPNPTGGRLTSLIATSSNLNALLAPFSTSGATVGVSQIGPAGTTPLAVTVAVNDGNLLNGVSFTGNLAAQFTSSVGGAPLTGTNTGDMGTLNRTFTHSVTGKISTPNRTGGTADFGPVKTAYVIPGDSLAGLSSTVSPAAASGPDREMLGSTATILAGINSGLEIVSMGWRARTTGESANLFSDAVRLNNTGGEAYVFQMTYSPAALAMSSFAPDDLFLGWLDGTGQWIKAVNANIGTGALSTGVAEAGAFVDLGVSGLADDLGRYGYDPLTNTVWGVIDHAGSFAAVASAFVEGDADGDGDVDFDDLGILLGNYDLTGFVAFTNGDSDGDSDVDFDDLGLLLGNYGFGVEPGGLDAAPAVVVTAAVPEPSTAALAAPALVLLARRSRRR